MTSLTALGIPVSDEQIDRWLGFYAPGRQPFRLSHLDVEIVRLIPVTAEVEVTDELRDTFFMYGGGDWAWLTEDEFADLSHRARPALADERRRRIHPKPAPAWPSDTMIVPRLIRWIEAGARPSLHALAQDQLNQASAGPLPRALELAGTFPQGSGPNCFGIVMAAAGLPVESNWVQQDQFAQWLAESTEPATRHSLDHEPGRVLVWRENGELVHAAVTLGGGWVLQKQSQSWSSPTLVWTVEELIRSWRFPGTQLSRHVLL